jgi:hypothetical protein
MGRPDPLLISTSYVEPQNLNDVDGDATLHSADQRLLQERREPRSCGGSLHFLHYSFARPHQSLGKRTTPAMAAGVASYPWSLTQVAGLLDGKVPSN